MAYYWECPQFGANLDPGERCECVRHREEGQKKAPADWHQQGAEKKHFTNSISEKGRKRK